MDQFLHKISIVCQKDESRRIEIQSAYRIEPIWAIDQIDHSLSASVIRNGRDHILRLVQKKDHLFFFTGKDGPVYRDLIFKTRFGAKFTYDLSIDTDPSLQDQLFRFSSRTVPASRNDLLKSLHSFFLSL